MIVMQNEYVDSRCVNTMDATEFEVCILYNEGLTGISVVCGLERPIGRV